MCLTLTGLTDGAAVVGLVGGVDAVGGGAVCNAAVHLSVGLAATSLTPGQLKHRVSNSQCPLSNDQSVPIIFIELFSPVFTKQRK